MSTDDLIRRARAHAAIWASWTDRNLLTELADEVDRLRTATALDHEALTVELHEAKTERDELRAEVDRLTARTVTLSETRTRLLAKYPHVGCEQVREEVESERDAARAALERAKDELIKHGKHIPDPQDEHLASADYWRGARDAVEHIQASVHFALEGEKP